VNGSAGDIVGATGEGGGGIHGGVGVTVGACEGPEVNLCVGHGVGERDGGTTVGPFVGAEVRAGRSARGMADRLTLGLLTSGPHEQRDGGQSELASSCRLFSLSSVCGRPWGPRCLRQPMSQYLSIAVDSTSVVKRTYNFYSRSVQT
jgi:hypothetical protein